MTENKLIKFAVKSSRVKNISFHPSKPWVIVAMRSGLIEMWDYNLKISIAKFQEHDDGVRAIDFHSQLPLFVSGGDDALVKVWDYKQKRCLFTLRGHIDYIRTAFFHNTLPWILTSCDDQTMRIWNYQSRVCINIITGHSHYVMCAQFHPQKNLIVSASLDSTVRIWDFSILKKKLTQSKNQSQFVGIQIECIKVLEGHQRGVNWAAFHPTQNLIASGSDDRKIKLWKYTNQVAWQHSTITGHKNNVSCVLFDKKTGVLISNSQDKTTKIWNIQTKHEKHTFTKDSDRFWIINQSKNGNLIGVGHDSGFQILELNQEYCPHGMIDQSLVIYAQGLKAYMYDAVKKIHKEQLYQFTPKNPLLINIFVNRYIINQFDSGFYIVQVNDNGEKMFTIKKKDSYLNFPYVIRNYQCLDTCFLSKTHVAVLQSPHQIHIISAASKDDKTKQILKLNKSMNIKNIFSSIEQNVLVFVTDDCIAQYDTKNSEILGQQSLDAQDNQVKSLVYGQGQIAVIFKSSIMITNHVLQKICMIKQKFPIISAIWNTPSLLFYTTTNHAKYLLMNGQNGLLKTLQKPIYLLKKISPQKFLAFHQEDKIFQTTFSQCVEIQFKLAVGNKDWIKVRGLLKDAVQDNRKYLVGYLVDKGLADIALEMVHNQEEKFSLAIQATNFQLAFQICNKINTPQYWKLLGDEALKQGIYQAYQLANQKMKNFDKLNFLYSLQANKPKLEKINKLSSKMNNPMLSFNVNLFLNNRDETQKILREFGLNELAALSAESRLDVSEHSDLLRRLQSQPLTVCQPQGDLDFSNWPHNVVAADQEEQA